MQNQSPCKSVDVSRLAVFRQLFKNRIAILDGAMGTMIQQAKLDESAYRGQRYEHWEKPLKGNHDLLCLTSPEIISQIHKAFLYAGADIIETNSFNANAISQSDYGTECDAYAINLASAQLARVVADEFTKRTPEKPRLVAGSMGPTNRTASISPRVDEPGYRNVSFDDLVDAYTHQIRGLIDGGVDLLLIETIFDTLNARAAIFAAEQYFESIGKAYPIMISGTVTDKSGRTLSGQTIPAFVASVKSKYAVSIGLNCAFGAKELVPYIQEIARLSDLMISVYPNAGLPNQLGLYEEKPKDTANYLKTLIHEGWVNIVGGCCGTTPEHIEAIALEIEGAAPRICPVLPPQTELAGLERIAIDRSRNFVNIGERTNVAGSAKFAKLIREGQQEAALAIALEQVENGAQVIDVNFDDGLLDGVAEMTTFLRLIASEPEISKVPIMIDSSRWEVLKAGLKAIQGKLVVNSISLKNGPEEFLEQAAYIQKHGAAVVVMAFDESGQADTYQRKIEIAKRAYDLLRTHLDFPAEDIIFDVNILAIGTGIEAHANYAKDYIEAVRWIKANLPHAKTSGGLSNLSFAFRGANLVREAMHSAFLFHAIDAGLDMAILNPSLIQIYDEVDPVLLKCVEDVIFNRHGGATDALIQYASGLGNEVETQLVKQQAWRETSADERLSYALVKGVSEYLELDLMAAKADGRTALALIEGPLMTGMKQVGALFGAGKMFLPQVVKTARVMKRAVSILQPYIESENAKSENHSAGKVVIATVKGDVHDIGKNIVSIVLQCNNFEVIDLGIMVNAETILDTAESVGADIVALSGLITPSLDEMVHVAEAMEQRQMKQALMIGGATTSKLHTALRIAKAYSGPVIYSQDAPQAVTYAKQLMNTELKDSFIDRIYSEYETVAQISKQHASPLISLEEARLRRQVLNFETVQVPSVLGEHVLDAVSVKTLMPYIDWTFFFTAWEMNGKFPEILESPTLGLEAQKLYADALRLLERHALEIHPKGVFGIYEANSSAEDIVIKTGEAPCVFRCFRQQKENSAYLALGDFIAPEGSGVTDYVGGFAVTSGEAINEIAQHYIDQGDDYSALILRTLGDRLAEAFAEYLHHQVRTVYWGYAKGENLSMAQIHEAVYRGIRPAFGYPSLIDHSEKRKLFRLLNITKHTGIELTESDMMKPSSSVCGLFFAHEAAQYFELFHIGKDQVEAYAKRAAIPVTEVEKRIHTRIKYQ